MNFQNTKEFALRLDSEDPLASYRERFVLDEQDVIYLDGNSLGRLPLQTKDKMNHLIEYEWGTRLIRSWNESWYDKPAKTAALISRLIGAKKSEVAVADSTSVNLYKLAKAAMGIQKGRTKIVSDNLNFPTDLYVLQGLASDSETGHSLELVRSRDGISIETEDIERAIDGNTALVVLSLVSYKSAFLYDMDSISKLAREKGALILWDLSHAAGAVPVDLNGCNADMAVGCTYKYLNGGPGAPAYLFVRETLQDELESPIWGWFGDLDPFEFRTDYKPAQGIRKFMAGTPPVMSLTALEPALNISLCAGVEKIREKSIKQTEYLLHLYSEFLEEQGFLPGSPLDHHRRGSHVTLKHPEAYRICKALINPSDSGLKVIPDFRAPDNIRLGVAPLYNSFEEIYLAVERILQITKSKLYEDFSPLRKGVT